MFPLISLKLKKNILNQDIKISFNLLKIFGPFGPDSLMNNDLYLNQFLIGQIINNKFYTFMKRWQP